MSTAESFFNDLPESNPEARLGIPRHKGVTDSRPWIRHPGDPDPAPAIHFDENQVPPRWVLTKYAPRRGDYFTRASSYGKPLESDTLIQRARERKIARGMARSEHLQTDALTVLDPDSKEGRDKLQEIAGRAAELEQIDDAAGAGTARHKLLEHHDGGEALSHLPERMRAMVSKWSDLTSMFRMVGMEGFVVCRQYGTAGSYDRVAEVLKPITIRWPDEATQQIRTDRLEPGERIVIDYKSGRWGLKYAGPGYGCQGWIYPNSTPYTHERGDGDWPDGIAPNKNWALIVALNPNRLDEAGLHWVNLRVARAHMDLVKHVLAARSCTTLFVPHQELAPSLEAQLLDWIPQCQDQAVLLDLPTTYPEAWTPAVYAAATKRWHESAVA